MPSLTPTASLADSRINSIYRMATLNSGKTKVVLFDESTRKYSVMKDVSIEPNDRVIMRLRTIFSNDGVIVK